MVGRFKSILRHMIGTFKSITLYHGSNSNAITLYIIMIFFSEKDMILLSIKVIFRFPLANKQGTATLKGYNYIIKF